MDDIQELPESSSTQNTLNSLRTTGNNAGEFGTANSKCKPIVFIVLALSSLSDPAGVGSSLRAFASSLGLKRALQSSNPDPQAVLPTTQDSLTANAIPYKSIPESSSPPKQDPFVLNDRQGDNAGAPLPGNPSLPGQPAPSNARMSLTVAPTNTTIRLVTTPFASTSSVVDTPPKLKPFTTSFDIVLGSPQTTVPRWPASPQNAASIYPPIPYDDLFSPAKPAEKVVSQNKAVLAPHEPDIFSPVPGEKVSGKLFSNTPSRPEPFLFGSPLPKNRLSNQDFGKAASSVLDEMNRRLGLDGDEKVGMSLLENRGKFKVDPAPASTSKPDLFGFDKAHEEAFAKMDSIVNHYAAKRGVNQTKKTDPQSSAKEDVVPGTKKRKSTALGVDDRRQPEGSKRSSIANTRITNNVTRKKVLPGGFGDDDEEEEEPEENRRMSKRPRVHLADPLPAPEASEEARKEEEERKKQREVEAVRRRADARRRSSRVSGAGPRKSVGRPSLVNAKSESLFPVGGQVLTDFLENKGTTSRFGFLSSAKNLVKNVWKGTGTNAAEPPKPTGIPVASSSKTVKPVASTSKPPPAQESTSSKNSKGSFKPISRFGFGSGSKTTATTSTTASSVTSSSRHDSMGQKKRDSGVRGVTNTDGSASSRVSNVSSNNSIGAGRVTGSTGVKRSSSTLLAPTASSLAKSRPSNSGAGPKRTSLTTGTGITQQKRASLLAAKEKEKRTSKGVTSPILAPGSALEPITNINTKRESSSRLGGGNGASLMKIFDQPLTADTFSSPSKIPVPASRTHTRTTSSSSTATNKDGSTPTDEKPAPSTGVPRRAAHLKTRGFVPRKPRISRSQVIARLGEKRAAAAATSSSTSTTTRLQPLATSKRMSADLGKGGRVRSSLGRQSYGGVKAKGRGSGVDASNAKKRARASEYYSKKNVRNSAVVQTSKGAGGEIEMDE